MDLCGYLEGPVNLNYISANKEKKKVLRSDAKLLLVTFTHAHLQESNLG